MRRPDVGLAAMDGTDLGVLLSAVEIVCREGQREASGERRWHGGGVAELACEGKEGAAPAGRRGGWRGLLACAGDAGTAGALRCGNGHGLVFFVVAFFKLRPLGAPCSRARAGAYCAVPPTPSRAACGDTTVARCPDRGIPYSRGLVAI